MPSILLSEALAAGEPWPDDAKLYQPEIDQIILPDKTACLSIETILKMCNLDCQIEKCTNAAYMSPSGEVPFLRCGKSLTAGVESIINIILSKKPLLSATLEPHEKADLKAYMSLVNVVLHYAQLYISWYDRATYNEVTKLRFGSVFPWPLNHIVCWQTKYDVKKKLKSADWHSKTLDEVYEEVNNCCHALSERLGDKNFFFENKPTELDAIVFGHLFSILDTPLPDNQLSNIVREYDNLVTLCGRIQKTYFEKPIEEDNEEDNNDFENNDIVKLDMENNSNGNSDLEKIEADTL